MVVYPTKQWTFSCCRCCLHRSTGLHLRSPSIAGTLLSNFLKCGFIFDIMVEWCTAIVLMVAETTILLLLVLFLLFLTSSSHHSIFFFSLPHFSLKWVCVFLFWTILKVIKELQLQPQLSCILMYIKYMALMNCTWVSLVNNRWTLFCCLQSVLMFFFGCWMKSFLSDLVSQLPGIVPIFMLGLQFALILSSRSLENLKLLIGVVL